MSGEYLYALFKAYQAFIGSIGFHLAFGRQNGEFQPWWQYDHVLNLLRTVFTQDELEELETLTIGRYICVTQNIESKFLIAAEDILEGRRAASEAFDVARKTLGAANTPRVP